MRASFISKITAMLILAAFCVKAPALAAPQAAASAATAKPATPKKVPVKTARKRKPRPRVQTAPTPARISEIQAALAKQGTYKSQPNGKWDSATIQAMRDFQSSHGLTATGKLDALSLQKLGLGSEIAGRAAPISQTPAAGASAGQQQTP